MNLATTLQLRISRTKKKLSNDRWQIGLVVICLLGLAFVLNISMRAASLSPRYGAIPVEIPLMAVAADDPSFHKYKEQPEVSMSATTTAVVLKKNGDFVFGDLEAFSTELYQVRNKFLIRQANGEPQIATLLERIRQWQFQRKETLGIKNDGIIVFLPASTTPITIVTQVVADIKSMSNFKRVVLANGLL